MKLHEKLELPAVVRDILQSPKSELKIGVLEDLRKAIVSCTVGEKYIQVDCEEAEQLAQAIERCTGRFGEVGKGSELLPAGARVVVDVRTKAELLADVDHVDVTARTATLNTVPGQPVMLQVGVVPAYALIVS